MHEQFRRSGWLVALGGLVWFQCASQWTNAATAPSVFGVAAPELARQGPFAVGVRTMTLVQPAQPDLLAADAATGTVPKHDRSLTVDIWYPALPTSGRPEIYRGSLPSEPPAKAATFEVQGIAVRGAQPARAAWPLVVVSHGYSNSTAAMTWLTENLASKGYVVAAIRHADPPLTDAAKFPAVLLRRPLDIEFVTRTLQAGEPLVDATKTALIGYSIGGYGVLSAAGATVDPTSQAAKMVPGGLLRSLAPVSGLKAVVAISPAGGGRLGVWGRGGLQRLRAPLLLIAGNQDRTVDYNSGARAFFDAASQTVRYLLTFKEAGHALGLSGVPDSMRLKLWDEDWFEDPVWRKERITGINMHFITAFLDRYVKGDRSRDAYLTLQPAESDSAAWPASGGYATYSSTLWKGFQHNHAIGLEWLAATPR